MKNFKHLLLILISITSLSSYAQTSKKTLNYQAVILDPNAIDIPGASISGQPLSKGNVCLRFSLLNTAGGVDYEETQQATTDEFGLVSLTIGTGTPSSGTSIYKSFESIVWNANVKSLKVSVSYDGCSSFKQVSTQALNYTPYALYAEAVDYKNVREAPTKLSQFSNDAGYLIPKDLDPIKADIKSNTSQIQTANQSIADNKLANDAAFLIVNQSLTSLDKQVADNSNSISTMNSRINDQQNQIFDNRNQLGGLQGQLNVTNSTVSNLSGAAEVVSNKSAATTLGGVNASDQLYPTQRATKTYVDQAVAQVANGTISDATTLAAGKIQLAGDLSGTATSPTVPALAGKENTSNKSLNVQADGTNDTKYPSVKAVKDYVDQATQGTALAADLSAKANIASPTFTGTVTSPIYASAPQALTDAATITWNPTNGLNANVTLGGNRTLSFSTAPASGSYGTLVVTQDGTGGRTLTLPSGTNKVLGSSSTTTIALSSAANAKDILNFYYDGLTSTYYWNVGQGYGTAATAATVNLATGVTGTLPVANGGTGATTITGLVKGNGTGAMTGATAGTDYLAPNGSAANLTNFPILNQNTTGNAATVTTNANLTGDVTSVGNASTVVKINGTSLAGLSTGILKNTTATGVPSIAIAGTDYQAPITLTTTGTGAATFTGTTLNIPTPAGGSSNTHAVGESYGGGVVFYTWDNGAHGLIVSLVDQCCSGISGKFSAGTSTNTLAYGGRGGANVNTETQYTTITGGGVGAGKKNTALIIASQGYGNGVKYAARYASEYSVSWNGIVYDDWYLGSVDEYHLLANNYPQVLANNSFTPLVGPNKDYWTSTEINQLEAYTVYIRTNSITSNIFNVFPNPKTNFGSGGYGNVRAIRSF